MPINKLTRKDYSSSVEKQNPPLSLALHIVLITCLLSAQFLVKDNLGTVSINEGDVIPLARQFMDAQWISQDWYLNQPAGYRLLFGAIIGSLANSIGWLLTSIVGRLICFILVATGLSMLGRKLSISLPILLLTVVPLLYSGQDMIAREWFVGALEAKAIAYGFVLIGIYYLIDKQYIKMSVWLGIATSFHVLVGGWAFLCALGTMLIQQLIQREYRQWKLVLRILLIYTICSSFAVGAVLSHLFSSSVPGEIIPSAIYVFIRLPHHLNPLSWDSILWLKVFLFSSALISSSIYLHRLSRRSVKPSIASTSLFRLNVEPHLILAMFAGLTMVPFLAGLAIAPFDRTGAILQYYPFRLADVMVPLTTYLLLGFIVQQKLQLLSPKIAKGICLIGLGISIIPILSTLPAEFNSATQFPSAHREISRASIKLYEYIGQSTPKDSTIITPPVDMTEFTWLTERSTIAKFKFLPQSEQGIVEWTERLSDLSNDNTWTAIDPWKDQRDDIRDRLEAGYNQLTTEQAVSLMQKYKASYFVRAHSYPLELPVAYENSGMYLYQNPS